MELNIAGCESGGPSPYHPLLEDQVRILVLQAGLPGSPLIASLRVVPLCEIPDHACDCGGTDHAHFEAISYCWGEPVFPKSCTFAEGGQIALTESLHSALQALRHSSRSRSLWADAVCINQTDLAERSSQVELMGDIFAKAARVLVWLGEPLASGSDTLAFVTLNAPITPQGDRSRKDLLVILEQHLSQMTTCGCCEEPITHGISLASGLSAVAKLLERPFFSRLWIVQEVVFAQSVEIYVGTHHAPWDAFTELSRVPGQYKGDEEYNDHRYTTAIPRSELRQIWAQCNYLNQLRSRHRKRKTDTFRPTELCKDLLMMSNLSCRNPHDRIFGVSRVLGLRNISGLRADYSVPVAEIFRRVAEVYVTAQANRSGGHAALLLALTSTETSEAKLWQRPSWVPDLQHLSERSRAKHTYYQWAFAERQYYADAAMFRCDVPAENPQELCVRGRCFGVVTNILEESQCPSKHVHRRTGAKCSGDEGVQLIRWYGRCREFVQKCTRSDCTTAKELEERLDALFACDVVKDNASLHEDTVLQWLQTTTDQAAYFDVQPICRRLKPYITGCPIDREHVLCTADCGPGTTVVGWVPANAKAGDRICHFAGAPYPFLIRPDTSGYTLLGDVFVVGYSEPEALGLDHLEWNSMLARIKRCDDRLKAWMQSGDRKAMREGKSSHEADVNKVDDQLKSAWQESIDRLKDLYRQGEFNTEWIRLR